jgi:lysophospholipase L1-like esterase
MAEIVAVGDSVTFGHGVEAEEAWAAVLARAFPGSRVINLGLSGAGPQQYRRVYETFGVPLKPRLLLIGFFARNDFWDAGLFDRWLRSGIGGNYMVWRDTGRPAGPAAARARSAPAWRQALPWPASALADGSYVFQLARRAWSAGKQRASHREVYSFPDGARLSLLPDDFREKTAGGQPGRQEYQLVVEALGRLAELAQEHGTRTIVILQPSKEEIYLPLLGISLWDPSEGLREALARLGVDFVDLTSVFRERAAAGRRLFFEEDGHPNAEGHALTAQAIWRHLQTRDISPPLTRTPHDGS